MEWGKHCSMITTELVFYKLFRKNNKKAYTINLGISYSKEIGGGFSRQLTLPFPTNNEAEIYNACLSLFDEYYDNSPIRKVTIRVTNLVEEYYVQLNLFKDMNKVIKDHKLHSSLDNINFKYGKNTALRASSLLNDSTVIARNRMIGGHHG